MRSAEKEARISRMPSAKIQYRMSRSAREPNIIIAGQDKCICTINLKHDLIRFIAKVMK